MIRSIGLLALLCAPAIAQNADVAATGTLSTAATPTVALSQQSPLGGSYSALLYDNGGLTTGVGNGFGGGDTSEIEATFNTFGYGHAISASIRVADDFTVPATKTWTLSDLRWAAYQTGSTTANTVNNVHVQIWNGSPAGGGTVIAGDLTTNRLVTGTFTNIYRVTATTLTNNTRPIMGLTVDMSWAPALPAGTYYIDVQCGGTLASGPWAPPTVPALATDNAEQFQTATGWVVISDATALRPQDFPFKLNGTESAGTTTYCTAKTTSNGCVPSIGSSGVASATAGSGFVVNGSNMINNKSCLLFYGTTGQASTAFQGGILCVKAPIKRTPGTTTGGNPPPNDCSGAPAIDMNLFAVGGGGGSPLPALTVPGTVVDCQWWGRDPGFVAPNNTQLSDGLEYTVGV